MSGVSNVGILRQDKAVYPELPPYNPPEVFPECAFTPAIDPGNLVYSSVRDLFRMLEYDREHFGTAAWNPLGWLIRPGETVFLKPNMISHKHRLSDDWDYVITHGSVIRAVTDYVYVALRGKGRIIIGDAPQTDSLFDIIRERMGLDAICRLYADKLQFPVELLDMRQTHHVDRDGIYVQTVPLQGDPRGSVCVDLKDHSMFAELDDSRKVYYGADYNWKETNEHHHKGRHEYAVSKSPLIADVFINLPKLKTHKKCGLTVNLKSLVGINANKNWLPHYVFGSPRSGGDQFERSSVRRSLENLVVRSSKKLLLKELAWFKDVARKTKRVGYEVFGDTEKVVRSGNWHGNDTVWRMSVDLNRILLYAEADGAMRPGNSPKRYLSIVDGIAAMEGNGPVAGTRREAGLLVGGRDPVAVDTICARLMGFDENLLPLIARAYGPHAYPLFQGDRDRISPVSNVPCWNRSLQEWRPGEQLGFRPHFGWTGTIEWREA
jgi:uncharacterized protein (DUF362 family)